jgi:hypothetical protein
MWSLVKNEPVLFQGVIQAALALAVAFGSNLDAAQIGAILAFSAAILSFATRTHVTPVTNPRASDGRRLINREAPAGV